MLYPRDKEGLIDYDTIFKLVVGKLKLPISYLDELTVREIGLLAEQYQEDQEDHYEMIALAFQLGYVNANTKGENQKLFDKKPKSTQNNNTTKEKMEEDIKVLKEMFSIDNQK